MKLLSKEYLIIISLVFFLALFFTSILGFGGGGKLYANILKVQNHNIENGHIQLEYGMLWREGYNDNAASCIIEFYDNGKHIKTFYDDKMILEDSATPHLIEYSFDLSQQGKHIIEARHYCTGPAYSRGSRTLEYAFYKDQATAGKEREQVSNKAEESMFKALPSQSQIDFYINHKDSVDYSVVDFRGSSVSSVAREQGTDSAVICYGSCGDVLGGVSEPEIIYKSFIDWIKDLLRGVI